MPTCDSLLQTPKYTSPVPLLGFVYDGGTGFEGSFKRPVAAIIAHDKHFLNQRMSPEIGNGLSNAGLVVVRGERDDHPMTRNAVITDIMPSMPFPAQKPKNVGRSDAKS